MIARKVILTGNTSREVGGNNLVIMTGVFFIKPYCKKKVLLGCPTCPLKGWSNNRYLRKRRDELFPH